MVVDVTWSVPNIKRLRFLGSLKEWVQPQKEVLKRLSQEHKKIILYGAENTIVRDKPLLAISAYHLSGDLFAIMDYLHQLLPEYRFWLRHYSAFTSETVLYASVEWEKLSENF